MRTSVILLIIVISLTVAVSVIADDLNVGEQLLGARGIAYGIQRDELGNLFITDWKLGEVWRVDPDSGAYTLFSGLGSTLDARPDAAGNIWLTSFWDPLFSRINTSANPVTMTTWNLTGWDSSRAYKLSGVAFDSQGMVWFSEWGEISDTQLLYRFDPATNQLCGYTMPGGNHSWYPNYQEPYLWMGDWTQALILRFDTTTFKVDYWSAGNKAEPRGMAFDDEGNIWWADVYASRLARLIPDINSLSYFSLPNAGPPNYATPYMIGLQNGKIWYTTQGDEVGTVGILDPSLAASSTNTVKRRTFTAQEICKQIQEGTTSTLEVNTGIWANPWLSRTWINATPPDLVGWTIYEAPGAEMPYGISLDTDALWFTDQMYNKLVRVALPITTPTSTPTTTQTAFPTQTSTTTLTSTSTDVSAQTPTMTQTNIPTSTPTKTPTPTLSATNTPVQTLTQTFTTTPAATRTKKPTKPPKKEIRDSSINTSIESQSLNNVPNLLLTPTLLIEQFDSESVLSFNNISPLTDIPQPVNPVGVYLDDIGMCNVGRIGLKDILVDYPYFCFNNFLLELMIFP